MNKHELMHNTSSSHSPRSSTVDSEGCTRRSFLVAAGGAAPLFSAAVGASMAASAAAPAAHAAPAASLRAVRGGRAAGPVSISSGNGLRTVARAVELMNQGIDPLAAAVRGVAIVEDDPDDMSVGYGGLPNDEGEVELDASVMHGPMHKAGAVAGIRNIKNPAAVALDVLRRTDHVLLVGEGAYRFARRLGHPHEELLTDRARRAWLRWRANLNPGDKWLDDNQIIPLKHHPQGQVDDDDDQRQSKSQPRLFERDPREVMAEQLGVPWSWGTIHCSAVDADGDLGACTTTSGLSYKIPGRVGDSPIIGAGMFVDNEVGAAGATGRGEAVIQSCGAFQIVRHMGDGLDPTEACLKVLQWIADHTRRHDLLNRQGRPNFDVTVYALRKDGAYGSATMRGRRTFTVCGPDGEARSERCAVLFE